MGAEPKRRPRNAWGEGGRLREDILGAARVILEREGTETAVSLRAIAREARITAPAIYGHFPDRESIVAEVIAAAFKEFQQAIADELQQLPADAAPLSLLRAYCLAYLRYAHQHPATYRIIFARDSPSALPDVAADAAADFADLVETLAACAPGQQRIADAFPDAVLLWAGLHGLATLPPHHPRFPWPDLTQLVDALLLAHAHVGPEAVVAARGLPAIR
jgi:AcrR family transcriptional regulator